MREYKEEWIDGYRINRYAQFGKDGWLGRRVSAFVILSFCAITAIFIPAIVYRSLYGYLMLVFGDYVNPAEHAKSVRKAEHASKPTQ